MLVHEVVIKSFTATAVQIWISLEAVFLYSKSVRVYSVKKQYLCAYIVAGLGKAFFKKSNNIVIKSNN